MAVWMRLFPAQSHWVLGVSCVLLTGPSTGWAQTAISGVVVTEATELPVSGAVVVGSGPSGERLSVATSADGTFRLEVSVNGRWSVGVTHLGFRERITAVDVPGDQPMEIRIILELDPIPLESLRVSVEARCPRAQDPDQLVALVREVSRVFLPSVRPIYSARYERRVQEVLPHNAFLDQPWNQIWTHEIALDTLVLRSDQPLRDLGILGDLAGGFIQLAFEGGESLFAYSFLAPSPEVVLSEAFVDTHCFEVVPAEDAERWAGLSFSPQEDSRVEYDLSGTIWLPPHRDSLPSIEFAYSRFPPAPTGEPLESEIDPSRHLREVRQGRDLYPFPLERVRPDERFGGRVDISPVAGVGWVPYQIEIRRPVVERVEVAVENRCCRLKEVWLVMGVRRITYRLLAVDPGGGGQ